MTIQQKTSRPNVVTRFLMALMGKSWAYESVEDVREVLAKNSFDAFPERVEVHAEGAATLTDAYAFQPGLIDLHADLHDVWHYLTAQKERARELGCATLAAQLGTAADSTRDALQDVATAAEGTVTASLAVRGATTPSAVR
ncbi:hypothetical protein [Streptomyces virginiae]|uniref:hypothetical protein n=1 Tax=Streptomyces virginiae TaxID=1961 RepID=UPI00224EAC6C|nr:hypothetical protein [Streptomyces virginiae]MCX5278020.1 hypothetical protein [Streptomyces virginiae]